MLSKHLRVFFNYCKMLVLTIISGSFTLHVQDIIKLDSLYPLETWLSELRHIS